jgi:hypothetical protein
MQRRQPLTLPGRLPPLPSGQDPPPLDRRELAPAGATFNCLCIFAASSLPCSRLAIASPPLLPDIIIIATAVGTRR